MTLFVALTALGGYIVALVVRGRVEWRSMYQPSAVDAKLTNLSSVISLAQVFGPEIVTHRGPSPVEGLWVVESPGTAGRLGLNRAPGIDAEIDPACCRQEAPSLL